MKTVAVLLKAVAVPFWLGLAALHGLLWAFDAPEPTAHVAALLACTALAKLALMDDGK